MTTSLLPDVSRETTDRLDIFASLLARWNARINLVSRSSLSEIWTRHIADSAQLLDLAPYPVAHWADLGAGGGFPGMVIAIMADAAGSPGCVTLVESDRRKAAFLRTAIRETGARATVICERIEQLAPLHADVISARALADLASLLGYAERHMQPGGLALFPKGRRWPEELATAQEAWNFTCQVARSKFQEESVILSIRGPSRA